MEKAIVSRSEAQISHILGIDYGSSKIGLSLADSETRMAFAYATLKNDKNFLEELAKIIKEKKVETAIIGIPSRINREEVEYDGEKLAKLIKKIFPEIKIEFQNEMFTTKIAQDNLIEKGVKGVKKFDDQEAARIILQSWIDKDKEKSKG